MKLTFIVAQSTCLRNSTRSCDEFLKSRKQSCYSLNKERPGVSVSLFLNFLYRYLSAESIDSDIAHRIRDLKTRVYDTDLYIRNDVLTRRDMQKRRIVVV